LHLVGILFPHINDDARSKSHQKYIKFDTLLFYPLSTTKNIQRYVVTLSIRHTCHTKI